MAGMHKEALETCKKLKEIGQELNYNSQVHDESCFDNLHELTESDLKLSVIFSSFHKCTEG
jgi:hypothetical protein